MRTERCPEWFSKVLQLAWIGDSVAKVRMQWLVVGSMCKDDGLLDCSCIRRTDYWRVNCSGRTCKLLGAGHVD